MPGGAAGADRDQGNRFACKWFLATGSPPSPRTWWLVPPCRRRARVGNRGESWYDSGPAAGNSDAMVQRMTPTDQGPAPFEPPTIGEGSLPPDLGGLPRAPGAGATRPRLRPLAFVVAAAGLVLAFLAMTPDSNLGWSLPVAILGTIIATVAILDGLGSFDGDPTARDGGAIPAPNPSSLLTAAVFEPAPVAAEGAEPVPFPWLRLIELGSAGVGCVAALRLAVAGALPWPATSAGLLVTGTFLWVTVALFRVAEAVAPDLARARPLLRRHGFWLVAIVTVLYLPRLGGFSLIDPWESHYGEVAREMLVRGDWITLWWAQDGLFFSKPPLDFWMQGIAFALLGVQTAPDRVLEGVARGLEPGPEWAARLPVFLAALIGTYVLYRGVASIWGRRAGLVAGLLLATMPYWFFLARQSMTDMPYAAPLAAALGLALLGFGADPEASARSYPLRLGTRVLALSAYHLFAGALLLLVLPQLVYLASRNLTWLFATEPRFFFRLHPDAFLFGSGGQNCGIPGNPPCSRLLPLSQGLLAQPAVTALLFAVVTALLLVITRGERRRQRLAFLGAWIAIALSVLGKGAPGLVIPLFAIACFVLAAGRPWDLGRLEPLALVLILSVIVLPWFVQSYLRHGWPFLDRLIFHDMYKRAFVHVHDTNAGADTSLRYYVAQLGYGTFPWSGLAGVGLVAWVRARAPAAPRPPPTALLLLWFVTTFSLFSLSRTKFHHYALPAAPALAALGGLLVDRALGDGWPRTVARGVAYGAAAIGAATALVLGVFFTRAYHLHGLVLDGRPGAPCWPAAAAALAIGAGCVLLLPRLAPRTAPAERHPAEDAALTAVALLACPIVALVGRDLTATIGDGAPGPARLMHLFIYNYERPWPPTLDFAPVLLAFTVVATGLTALLAVPAVRSHAAALLLALGIVWTTWAVDVYLVATAPHWGQRETIATYYRRRLGPEEPLLAYQLNWKGENFYTGNRLGVFVADDAAFKAHLAALREQGRRVIFVTTEQRRVSGLERALGGVKRVERLIPREQNARFALVRVEL